MNPNTSTPSPTNSDHRKLIVKGSLRLSLFLLIQATILFSSSGHLDWIMAWVWLSVFLICIGINLLILMRYNPDVIRQRLEEKWETQKWDNIVLFMATLWWLVALLTAGLDYRFSWSPSLPWSLQVIAIVMFVLGDFLFVWAMTVNKFFSKLVRIQTDRGHQVVTVGPYRYVRHPGYVGWITMATSLPVILGALWALLPMLLAIGSIVTRTALEDRTLQEGLNGYREYAEQVRYRLVPGIW
jgi:protein-S-isoprenylcysteine O-methyltransferase Ste14